MLRSEVQAGRVRSKAVMMPVVTADVCAHRAVACAATAGADWAGATRTHLLVERRRKRVALVVTDAIAVAIATAFATAFAPAFAMAISTFA